VSSASPPPPTGGTGGSPVQAMGSVQYMLHFVWICETGVGLFVPCRRERQSRGGADNGVRSVASQSDLTPETRWMAGPLREDPANSWTKVMGREKVPAPPGLERRGDRTGASTVLDAPSNTPRAGRVQQGLLESSVEPRFCCKTPLIKSPQLKTPPRGGGPSVKAAHIESWSVETLPSKVRRM
jgi:hypothetical protein